MKKLNEKGFSAVEAILLLVIVSLIGFVGWYVLQSKNKSNTTQTVITDTDKKGETITKFIIPSDWVEYKYERLGISLSAPKDWKIEQLEQVEQLSIDAPSPVTAMTTSGENETFRFHINIASPSPNSTDKVQTTTNIISSTALTTSGLLKDTYITLNKSSDDIYAPGIDSFSVTQQKYSTNDKSYKPAMLINNKSYEVWGGIFYVDDTAGGQPTISLENFNNLVDYKTAQGILSSIKLL